MSRPNERPPSSGVPQYARLDKTQTSTLGIAAWNSQPGADKNFHLGQVYQIKVEHTKSHEGVRVPTTGFTHAIVFGGKDGSDGVLQYCEAKHLLPKEEEERILDQLQRQYQPEDQTKSHLGALAIHEVVIIKPSKKENESQPVKILQKSRPDANGRIALGVERVSSGLEERKYFKDKGDLRKQVLRLDKSTLSLRIDADGNFIYPQSKKTLKKQEKAKKRAAESPSEDQSHKRAKASPSSTANSIEEQPSSGSVGSRGLDPAATDYLHGEAVASANSSESVRLFQGGVNETGTPATTDDVHSSTDDTSVDDFSLEEDLSDEDRDMFFMDQSDDASPQDEDTSPVAAAFVPVSAPAMPPVPSQAPLQAPPPAASTLAASQVQPIAPVTVQAPFPAPLAPLPAAAQQPHPPTARATPPVISAQLIAFCQMDDRGKYGIQKHGAAPKRLSTLVSLMQNNSQSWADVDQIRFVKAAHYHNLNIRNSSHNKLLLANHFTNKFGVPYGAGSPSIVAPAPAPVVVAPAPMAPAAPAVAPTAGPTTASINTLGPSSSATDSITNHQGEPSIGDPGAGITTPDSTTSSSSADIEMYIDSCMAFLQQMGVRLSDLQTYVRVNAGNRKEVLLEIQRTFEGDVEDSDDWDKGEEIEVWRIEFMAAWIQAADLNNQVFESDGSKLDGRVAVPSHYRIDVKEADDEDEALVDGL